MFRELQTSTFCHQNETNETEAECYFSTSSYSIPNNTEQRKFSSPRCVYNMKNWSKSVAN